MFAKSSPSNYAALIPGIEIKTLVHGESTLMSEFRLKTGSLLPKHAHPYEQTGYLVSGRLALTIGGERRELAPGASWCVPANVEHTADVLEDSVAIEVFSPARSDYLPYLDRGSLL